MHSEIWPAFLERGGEMGERIRAFDWSNHPLGPPETWPQPLRMAIRLILNTGHPMYIWWGPELYCFYNDAYRQSIGPERHPGSLGRPGREVWDEIWHIIGPQIRQVMAGGSATWNVNALVPITRNGRREDVYWTYSYGPIDDERAATGVGGILVVCTETTATVMAEKRLAAKSERERRPFEQAPGFIIVMGGPDHVVEFVNDAHRALFNSADWVGKPVREAVPSIDGQGLFEHLDTVYATGESYEAAGAEIRFRRSAEAAEETRFLTFIFTPWFGGDGEIAGIFCEGFDVTEARHGEAALRESEALLRLATEAAAIGIWDYHPVSDELRWDRRCRELFGVSEDAAISYESTFLAGLHPEDRARIDAAVQSALAPAGSGIYNVEFRTIGIEDGVERWLAASGNAMFEAGRAVRFVGTLRDITPRVRADRRLEIVNRTGAADCRRFRSVEHRPDRHRCRCRADRAQFGAFFYNVADEAGEHYTLYASLPARRALRPSREVPPPRNTPVFAPTFKVRGRSARTTSCRPAPRHDGRLSGNAARPFARVRSYLAVPVVARTGEVHGGLFFGHGEVARPGARVAAARIAGHAATAIDNARLVHDLQSLNANLEQRVTAEVADRLRAEEMLVQSQKLARC
ncbi:MAG: PAS domain-containing protein [Geminicoccaceae bacterium]